MDLKQRKIRFNAIGPGFIDTDLMHSVGNVGDFEKFIEYAKTAAVLGRVGTPDKVAKPVVFLASDDSSYINGIELYLSMVELVKSEN